MHAIATLLLGAPSALLPGQSQGPWTQAELERVSAEIKAEVETLRGLSFKRPVKVELADKKGFLAYARKRQEISMTPGRVERDELAAKLLGLIPRDMDLMAALETFLEDQVGGFYDPSSDTFFLMDSFTGPVAKVILAHELTHALDDQHFDIDGKLKALGERSDAELAFQAVVEGSGTSAMNQWTVKHLSEMATADLTQASAIGSEALADAPAYLWKPLIAVYLRGEGFLVRNAGLNLMMKPAKVDDVRRAFEDPPRSTEQVLHPEKYWDAAKRDDPVEVDLAVESLEGGWRLVGEDTLGELLLAIVATPHGKRGGLDAKDPRSILGVEYTNEAAQGWGGDRVAVLAKGDERCLALVTVWDSAEDARQFDAAARASLPEGSEVTLAEATRSVEVRSCLTAAPAAAGLPRIAWTAAGGEKPR